MEEQDKVELAKNLREWVRRIGRSDKEYGDIFRYFAEWLEKTWPGKRVCPKDFMGLIGEAIDSLVHERASEIEGCQDWLYDTYYFLRRLRRRNIDIMRRIKRRILQYDTAANFQGFQPFYRELFDSLYQEYLRSIGRK